jgi:DNA-binding LytR/AlgR family response regulator
MKALIIEDELPAANRLQRLIARCDEGLEISTVLDSVEAAVDYLKTAPLPDLLFADIHLADGLSFEIFRQVQVDCPVIFTTAYDEYTLRAFKLNSVDYLLKPIEESGLREALQKFRKLYRDQNIPAHPGPDERLIKQLLEGWGQPKFRQRFLLRRGERLDYVHTDQVAFVYSENGLTHLVDQQGHRDLLERTLDMLDQELDPGKFFRISRKCIIALPAIRSIHKYFSGRLKLDLEPAPPFEVLVSRDRVDRFQAWLDR